VWSISVKKQSKDRRGELESQHTCESERLVDNERTIRTGLGGRAELRSLERLIDSRTGDLALERTGERSRTGERLLAYLDPPLASRDRSPR